MIKSWPTAVVLVAAILAIVATLLLAPVVGLDPGLVRWALGAEGVGATLLLAGMRGLFHDHGGES